MECIKKVESAKPPLRFPTKAEALGWLNKHRSEVAVGTVVIVAGAAFVVATGGAGALILTPLAL